MHHRVPSKPQQVQKTGADEPIKLSDKKFLEQLFNHATSKTQAGYEAAIAKVYRYPEDRPKSLERLRSFLKAHPTYDLSKNPMAPVPESKTQVPVKDLQTPIRALLLPITELKEEAVDFLGSPQPSKKDLNLSQSLSGTLSNYDAGQTQEQARLFKNRSVLIPKAPAKVSLADMLNTYGNDITEKTQKNLQMMFGFGSLPSYYLTAFIMGTYEGQTEKEEQAWLSQHVEAAKKYVGTKKDEPLLELLERYVSKMAIVEGVEKPRVHNKTPEFPLQAKPLVESKRTEAVGKRSTTSLVEVPPIRVDDDDDTGLALCKADLMRVLKIELPSDDLTMFYLVDVDYSMKTTDLDTQKWWSKIVQHAQDHFKETDRVFQPELSKVEAYVAELKKMQLPS